VLGPPSESKGGDLLIAAFDVAASDAETETVAGGEVRRHSLAALKGLIQDGYLECVEGYFKSGRADTAAICGVYKVTPEELALQPPQGLEALEAAVLQRIACGIDV